MKAGDLDYVAPPTKNKEKEVKPKYVLLVDNGTYSEDNLLKLFYNVILHRINHFLKGEGFRD
jgi:hypothetical protein